jgi:hypothetical protein
MSRFGWKADGFLEGAEGRFMTQSGPSALAAAAAAQETVGCQLIEGAPDLGFRDFQLTRQHAH